MHRHRLHAIAMVVIGMAGFPAVTWYFWPQGPPGYATVLRAGRLTVYEGLPHRDHEEKAFQEESRARPTVQLSGFPFYHEPLDLKDEDVERLRALLGDEGTYQPYTGEKKCGGFHPDYAVEWSYEGDDYLCLICFGCSEAKFDGPRGKWYFYLRPEVGERGMKLLDLLKDYRRNRPPHERFGMGPLAFVSPRGGFPARATTGPDVPDPGLRPIAPRRRS